MRTLTLLLSVFLLVGCVTGTSPTTPPPANDTGSAITPDVAVDAGSPDLGDWYVFEAGPFTVPVGKERFLCYSHVLEEDLHVDKIQIEAHPVVHHAVYSKAGGADPDGFFECDTLFRTNWVPIFVSGTGDAEITMPENAGHVLPKGTQLTLQLHLLNATVEEVTTTIPMRLRKMSVAPTKPVEVVVFGTMALALPPGEISEAVGQCASDSDMKIFSVFPHMHLLGQRMVVETGPDADNLVEVFRRDPYVFDAQSLSPIDVTIKAGDIVRVTCGYENTLDEVVTFGESTTNEMCFFIGFATQATHELAGCIGSDGASFVPEGCGEDPPNEIGLGAPCTKGGGECDGGLFCTEDNENTEGLGVCIGFGCESSADCGDGGVCCNIDAAGIALCLPPSCVFSVCSVLD